MPSPSTRVVPATLASLLLLNTPSVLSSQDLFTPVFVVPSAHMALLCFPPHADLWSNVHFRARPSLTTDLEKQAFPHCCPPYGASPNWHHTSPFAVPSSAQKHRSCLKALCLKCFAHCSLSLEQCPTCHRSSKNMC